MLKKFFISLLGTVAGIWISFCLIIFGGLLLVGVAGASSGKSSVTVEKNSILYLDLNGIVEERYKPGSLLEVIQNAENDMSTLDEMVKALRLAADDKKIEGLFIDCNGASMGVATRQELIDAIRDFKESGKWVYAYADAYAQGDYIIATLADRVYMNPQGACDIHGVATQIPFFKNLLDKLGVKMQIIKVGSFKSAVEPYILTEMSDPSRLQTQVYVDSIWEYMSDVIAANRNLPIDSVKYLATQMLMARPARASVEAGLVDSLVYRRNMENILRELTDVGEGKDLRLVSPKEYVSFNSGNIFTGSKKHIAVLYAVGDIVDSGEGGIVGSEMVPEIIDLAENDNVEALVLRVNSGGGSAFASEQIWEALEYFKSKGKKFYVSMGDYAASGGYYISCGADCIYADATTLTGSIGVFGMIPDFSGLVTDKLGVNFGVVSSNENADFPSGVRPMTPAQYAAMQGSVEDIYEVFTGRVSEGRGMRVDSVKAIAEGRVWVGASAIRLGLVDKLGSLTDCIADLADDLGMSPLDVVEYPSKEEEFWEKLLRESGQLQSVSRALDVPDIDAETAGYLRFVDRLRKMNHVQARMEETKVDL